MQKYVEIVLMKLYRISPSDKLPTNSIYIVLWRIVYIVSIKEEIIQNTTFQCSGSLLVILIFSRNVDFGDIR